jgi:hypothetical protein
MADEISGAAPPGRRGRTVLFVLVAAAVAVGGVVALRRGVDRAVLTPAPTSIAAQLPAPPGVPTPGLSLGDVCRPVRPTGPSGLDVSFSLRNNSSAAVTLTNVEPKLPLAGLKERGYSVRDGNCEQTGRPLADNRTAAAEPVQVQPATFVVATLHFALPPTCPQPYPVQTVITERHGVVSVSTDYPLLPDLSGVPFATC